MIHTYIPYAPKSMDKNIGAVYNNFMNIIPEGDWACFLDHDAMFTTLDWYKQLENIVEGLSFSHPDAGLLTVCTNRIGNFEQRVEGIEPQNHDIYHHRKIGKQRQTEYGSSLRECEYLMSGVVILISKEVWKKTSGFTDGFLSVDNDIDRKIRELGYKSYIMDGVYCYHWYRADGIPIQGMGYLKESNLPSTGSELTATN
jgi:GT2 family glycosyltransferase